MPTKDASSRAGSEPVRVETPEEYLSPILPQEGFVDYFSRLDEKQRQGRVRDTPGEPSHSPDAERRQSLIGSDRQGGIERQKAPSTPPRTTDLSFMPTTPPMSSGRAVPESETISPSLLTKIPDGFVEPATPPQTPVHRLGAGSGRKRNADDELYREQDTPSRRLSSRKLARTDGDNGGELPEPGSKKQSYRNPPVKAVARDAPQLGGAEAAVRFAQTPSDPMRLKMRGDVLEAIASHARNAKKKKAGYDKKFRSNERQLDPRSRTEGHEIE